LACEVGKGRLKEWRRRESNILVRYVTRAGDRLEMRNKLYSTVIELLAPAGGGDRRWDADAKISGPAPKLLILNGR
jgi:hypothetical protein